MKIHYKIAIILVLLVLTSVSTFALTGQVIENKYSYTKAICNESNFCQDYNVICEDKNLVSINPINGAIIQNSANWEDPRGEPTNNYCN